MNKEEAIKELQKQARHHCGEIECYNDGCEKSVELSKAINIISKIQKQKKVVVPKFVADWIETHKRCMPFLSHLFTDNLDEEINEWLDFSDNQNLMAKAWLYGYDVEKDKLYTVEIPNPNMNSHVILQKTKNKVVLIVVTNARWKGLEGSKLTESEIKQNFAWAWDAGFAREVE